MGIHNNLHLRDSHPKIHTNANEYKHHYTIHNRCKNAKTQKLPENIERMQTPPDLHTPKYPELRKITDIVLKINAAPSTDQHELDVEQQTTKTYKCPTCTYVGSEAQYLLKHRQMKRKCKKQWAKEGAHKWEYRRKNCTQTCSTKKEMGRHKLYYLHGKMRQNKHTP